MFCVRLYGFDLDRLSSGNFTHRSLSYFDSTLDFLAFVFHRTFPCCHGFWCPATRSQVGGKAWSSLLHVYDVPWDLSLRDNFLAYFPYWCLPFDLAFYILQSKILQSWTLLFVKVYVQLKGGVKNINPLPLFENKRRAQRTPARWLRFDFFIIMLSFSLPGETRRTRLDCVF